MSLILLSLTTVAGPGSVAQAQSITDGGQIGEIVIRGTQRIEPTTVRSYLEVDPGDRFDAQELNRSLKGLYDTGLFEDVVLSREGDRLIVDVQENPIINRIAFEGNDELDEETLRQEVELRPRVVYTRTKVQNDVDRLLEVYRRNGYYGAEIEPKLIELEQNRVDLVFEVDEGPETEVRAINFVGNEAFSDSELRDQIATEESAWWKLLGANDTYDPDRLSFDREQLRRFYLSEGYAEFEVRSAVAELTPDREAFVLTFTVSEGDRYKFGAIDVSSSLKGLEPEQVEDAITTEEGDWYDASAVEETISNLERAVGDLGYAFVEVRPQTDRDRDNDTIGVTYRIEEGPKVFVERIEITGNVRTLDRVIRREFQLVEGDAFNASKLRRSRERIQNLGFFKEVNVDTQRVEGEAATVVNVDVQEQSTGSLTFGAGFSTSDGPLGAIQLRERNLLGKGQDLQLNLTLSGASQRYDLSFTEPYFMGEPVSAGFDLFRTSTSRENDTFGGFSSDSRTYDETELGGALRTGYDLIDRWRQSWRYRYSRRTVENVEDDAAVIIKRSEGTTNLSSITHRLSYNGVSQENMISDGFEAFTENTFAGLGGDVTFVKNVIGANYYQPVVEEWSIVFGAEVGNMFGVGEDTRVNDRFFIGSDEVRGFDSAGLSPRDKPTGDPIGAKNYYAGTVELRFPIGLGSDLPVRGRIFADTGASFGVDDNPNQVLESSSPRVAVGVGMSWRSPIGPLELDLGFPVVKEDFDEEQIFKFSFGTSF
ncbi:outer membrane protein assembly factor BamA [Rhodovibrio salinarum]|uniref:Outer membrane protein assembly factor BamA n=1 Tax=Rhodovibrio salinarum TaxID=1087 RepID=A0A934QJX5_9PROT|nr:outer membrane protein assembly factor BamA [Rhodovibrio salinarum]MBK1697815.1 outer membrane protein assembly factor BamA [Rhodovibrio salinarum]